MKHQHPAIEALHAETPLRVWSLVATVFGDIVMDAGANASPPPLWSGPLTELMALVGVDAGPLRTSLSRLVAAGTLERGKEGRNTFYTLGEDSRRAFLEAGGRIYGEAATSTGRCHLALIDRAVARPAARDALVAAGWRFIGPTTALLPEHDGIAIAALPAGVIRGRARFDGALATAVFDAFDLGVLDEGYGRFLSCFGGLAEEGPANPAEAAALRLLLVHQFRRLVLKDPLLSKDALPAGWRGGAARKVFSQARARLHGPSEIWLAANGFRPVTSGAQS